MVDIKNFKRYHDQKGRLVLYDPHRDEYFYYPSGLLVRKNRLYLVEGVKLG